MDKPHKKPAARFYPDRNEPHPMNSASFGAVSDALCCIHPNWTPYGDEPPELAVIWLNMAVRAGIVFG